MDGWWKNDRLDVRKDCNKLGQQVVKSIRAQNWVSKGFGGKCDMLGVAISPCWLIMYPDIYIVIQTNILKLVCVSFSDKKKLREVLIYIPIGKLLSQE